MLDPIKFAYLLHSINFVFSTVNFTENCNSIIFSDLIENHYEAHETITVISEEGFDESLSLANPFMIMNIEKSILSKTLYFNNYVILLKNSSIIEKLLRNLSETNLWNPFVSPLAKYLIIVQNSNQSTNKIFSALHAMDIIDSTIVNIIPNGTLIYERNPYSKGCLQRKCKFTVGYIIGGTFAPLINAESSKPGIIEKTAEVIGETLDLEIIMKPMDFKMEFVLNGTVFNHVAAFQEGTADVIPIAARLLIFFESFSTTNSFFFDDIHWAIAKPPKLSNLQILGCVFSKDIWLPYTCSNIIIVVTLFLTTRLFKRNTEFSNVLLQTIGLLLGLGNISLSGCRTLKLLLIIFMFYSLHFISLYQAKLSSILTKPIYQGGVNNVEDLVDFQNTFPLTSFYTRKIQLSSDIPMAVKLARKSLDLKHFMGAKETLDYLINYPNVSMPIYTSYLIMYPGYKNKLKTIGNEFLPNLEVFFTMRKGHSLLKKLNKVLNGIHEAGLAIKWLKNMEGSLFSKDENDNIILTYNHIEGAVLILLVGFASGSCIFALEILMGKYE